VTIRVDTTADRQFGTVGRAMDLVVQDHRVAGRILQLRASKRGIAAGV